MDMLYSFKDLSFFQVPGAFLVFFFGCGWLLSNAALELFVMPPYFGVGGTSAALVLCVAVRLTPTSVLADIDFLKFFNWSDSDMVMDQTRERRIENATGRPVEFHSPSKLLRQDLDVTMSPIAISILGPIGMDKMNHKKWTDRPRTS